MLSDVALRRAAARDKDYKLTDGKGLYLLVKKGGSKLWRYDYRFDGLRKTMALGAYPEVGLQEAREIHFDARKELRAGIDPMASRKREAVSGITFEQVGRRWLANQGENWTPRYYGFVERRLEADVFEPFGHLPIASIEPPVLLKHIRKIEDRGAIETAKRVKNHCGHIFRFGIAEGLCERDPSADIRNALKPRRRVKHRARVTERQLPEFLNQLDDYNFEADTYDAIILTLLTAVRTTETRFCDASEFEDIDGEKPIWRISPERMKMSREHLVPLSRQAVEVVKRRIAKHPTGLLFARETRSGTISENTMLYAMYRLGYHGRATVHGLRSTFSTIAYSHAEDQNFNGDWIEMALAHVEENEVKGAYNSAEYLPQRRRLLQWWADFVDEQRAKGVR